MRPWLFALLAWAALIFLLSSFPNPPGPRGPVTYRDLWLRQYRVVGDGSQHRWILLEDGHGG